MLWFQGFADAPPLVQACLESWRRFNPTWRVVALNRASLPEWVDLDQAIDPERRDLDMRKVANVARLCLLRRHGGVWADATSFCLRPLDDCLDAVRRRLLSLPQSGEGPHDGQLVHRLGTGRSTKRCSTS
jgi:mannosyltransferase OCH1-like enzyme